MMSHKDHFVDLNPLVHAQRIESLLSAWKRWLPERDTKTNAGANPISKNCARVSIAEKVSSRSGSISFSKSLIWNQGMKLQQMGKWMWKSVNSSPNLKFYANVLARRCIGIWSLSTTIWICKSLLHTSVHYSIIWLQSILDYMTITLTLELESWIYKVESLRSSNLHRLSNKFFAWTSMRST
jgi:hypothetical protein